MIDRVPRRDAQAHILRDLLNQFQRELRGNLPHKKQLVAVNSPHDADRLTIASNNRHVLTNELMHAD